MTARTLLVLAIAALAAIAPAAAEPPPAVQAQAYVVRGAPDGGVLAARASNERRAVASITKLMTVLVALEHADLDDVVTIPAAATSIGESTVQLRAGERLTVRELAQAALIPSANDAATALALHVGGGSLPRFVALMNAQGARARDERHPLRATARPRHARARLHRRGLDPVAPRGAEDPVHPRDRRAADAPRSRVGGRSSRPTTCSTSTRTSAVARPGTRISPAGRRSPRRGRADVTVWAAALGSPSREQRNTDLIALLRWGLAQYRPVKVVDRARTYATASVPYGLDAVPVVAPRTIVRLARVERPLVERTVAATSVVLPVRRGQRLGEVRVYDGRRLVAVSPLVAARSVAEPGTIDKAQWYATRTLENVWSMVT